MKGYKTSTDYSLLWKLIQDGYRVPGWLLFSDKHKVPIFDIVEIKKGILGHSETYMIGTRGYGYGMEGNETEFELTCKAYKLRFIPPEIEKKPGTIKCMVDYLPGCTEGSEYPLIEETTKHYHTINDMLTDCIVGKSCFEKLK